MSLTNKERVTQFLTRLKTGSLLTKRKHNGERYFYQFFLDEHENFVSYHQSENSITHPHRYYIPKIDEIRLGLQTRTFDRLVRHKMIEESDAQRAFSIFYNNYRKELHLMADDENTRDMWVHSLQYLVDTNIKKRQQHIINERNWILNHFYLADKDRSNTLTKEECRRLLIDVLNAKISHHDFELLFKEADKNGEGLLSPNEFIDFFQLLTRRKDLYRIMQQYVKNGDYQSINTISMNIDELLYFLQHVQNQKIILHSSESSDKNFSLQLISTHEQVQNLIHEFEMNDELREKGQLSLTGFTNLLLSDDFSIINPWCSQHIYQDMTKPLSHYYINTSHNTYLFNTQLVGDSNPEAYNRALRAGCRAVEIDIYDGDHGRPIVKHGHTLVKPCLFESIIRFIEPNLFKTSPYPVILDFENHCSMEQQYEIAKILRKYLGDRLIVESLLVNDLSELPSPNDLKYKVLIRGVKISRLSTIPRLFKKEIDDDNKEIEPNLADLIVYLQNVPYRPHEYSKDNQLCYQSSSLSEKNFDHVVRNDPIGFIKQTRKSVYRVYPDGLRQDSSNQNPIHPWNFGVQMVALNYEHDDSIMSLCYGKFLDNGGCGYILKPKYLTDIYDSKFNPFDYLKKPKFLPSNINESPQRLIIQIISGHFISRSSEKTNDIPDPYVVVSTHGISCDQQSHKTIFIDNNGFDPEWNQTFQFDIHFPQMCLIRFEVFDHDRLTKDDRLAYFCLPMTTIQTGYRHIHLRAKNNDLTYSTLFVHVAITNI